MSRSLIASILIMVAVGIGYTVFFQDRPANVVETAHPLQSQLDASRLLMDEQIEIATTDAESSEDSLLIDWNHCLDDLTSDACVDAIKPLIDSVSVVGNLSYVDLIERLESNLVAVEDAVVRSECQPPVEGWSESQAARAECGAKAFAELGELIRGCREAGDYDDLVNRIERSGITDLQQLFEAEQADRYARVRYTWLSAKCPDVIEAFSVAPVLVPNLEALQSYGDRDQKAALAYIERAVLLGDYRVADRYVESAMEMSRYRYMFRHEKGYWRDLTGSQRPRFGDEKVIKMIKAHDASIARTVAGIVTQNPEVGYQQLADYEYFRYPDYEHHRPDEFDGFVSELNDAPQIRSGEAPEFFEEQEDWSFRTFNLVKYQLVANRLAGRSEELHFSEAGAGNLSRIEGMIERHLDGNDLEYASQQAWEIVEQLQRDEEKSLSP